MREPETPFERFLAEHDAEKLGRPPTHTNMRGGGGFSSGTYALEGSAALAEFRRLYLAAEKDNYRHGLTEMAPPVFKYYVDLDPGKIAKRPVKKDVQEWAVDMARATQAVIAESGGGAHAVYVMQIVARRPQGGGGWKPGVHLHVPSLAVDIEQARALTQALTARFVAPRNFDIAEPPDKVLDTAVYANGLRTLYGEKRTDGGNRYRLGGIVRANGGFDTKTRPTAGQRYDAVSLYPAAGQQRVELQLFAAAPGVAGATAKRVSETPPDEEPGAKRQLSSVEEEAAATTVALPVPPTALTTAEDLIRERVMEHFPQANIKEITRKSGIAWVVTLRSFYCWIKGELHDSASAYLTVTHCGIQPKCQSTKCNAFIGPPRKPVFTEVEKRQFFGAGDFLREFFFLHEPVSLIHSDSGHPSTLALHPFPDLFLHVQI